MAVTRDYVLVMDTAFRVEPQQLLAQDFVQAEDLDTVLYIVRRADLAGGGGDVFARKVVIPRAIAHFVANYDNPNSEITLHLTHACGWLPSEWLRADDVRADTMAPVRNDLLGMLVPSSDMTPIARHVIDVETGTIVSSDLLYHEDFTWSVTLYTHRGSSAPDRFEHLDWAAMGFQPELLTKRVFDLSAAYQYRYTPIEQLPFDSGKRAALFRTDATTVRSEDSDGYVFPAGRALSSPQFVPAKGRTGRRMGTSCAPSSPTIPPIRHRPETSSGSSTRAISRRDRFAGLAIRYSTSDTRSTHCGWKRSSHEPRAI
jgi:hypothetical protein